MDVEVANLAGDVVGQYRLDTSASVLDLKLLIANAGGALPVLQELVAEAMVLKDDCSLGQVTASSSGSKLLVTLSVQDPVVDAQSEINGEWKHVEGSGGLLDNLWLSKKSDTEQRGYPSPMAMCPYTSYQSDDIKCVGMDPDSGLLFITCDTQVAGGKGKGKDKGTLVPVALVVPSKTTGFEVPMAEGDALDHAIEMHVVEMQDKCLSAAVGAGVAIVLRNGEGKGTLSEPGRNIAGEKGKGKGKGKGKEKGEEGKGEGKGKGTEKGEVGKGQGKGKGTEKGEEGKGKGKGKGKVVDSNVAFPQCGLIQFDFCPGFLKTSSLCLDPEVDFEAVWLDRSVFPAKAVCAERHPDGTQHVSTRQLRTGAVEKLFCIPSAGGCKRITSIAWTTGEASAFVLFTTAGSHTVSIYNNMGAEGWQAMAVIGGGRGNQDGPADQCLFWFPCEEQRVLYDDSHPLVQGQDGSIFVYSGGVLMKFASDLSSATKFSSMRQELWITDGDEGTPEFPDVYRVLGVHEDKIYRLLKAVFGGGGWLVRRLQTSALLRRPRREIRRVAPELWPNITEHKTFDLNDSDPDAPKPCCGGHEPSQRPARYNKEDMDRWDGDPRWIHDDFLKDGGGHS